MNVITQLLSFSALMLITIIGISGGSHGNIVAPFIYIIFYYIFHNKHQALLYVGVLSMVFLLFFSQQMHQLRSYQTAYNTIPLTEVYKLLYSFEDSPVSDIYTANRNFLDKVEWRFGENSRKSVGYIRMYDDGESPSYMPLINSLYLLPRNFYKDKPVPGSVDGDASTTGMRLIHNKIDGAKWNMSAFFTGLHSFWEYGFTGLIVTSILIGLYSAAVILFCGNLIYLGLPLIIVLHDTWWEMPKLWSSEVVIQFTRIVIPFLIVWYIYKYIYIIIKNIFKQP